MGFSAKNFLFEAFNKSCKDNNIPTLEDDTKEINHIKNEYIEDGNLHFIKDNCEDIAIDTRDIDTYEPIQQSFIFKGKADNLSEIEAYPGEIYVEASTNKIYIWIDNQWMLMTDCVSDYETKDYQVHGKRTKKIIPYPSHCKSCGSPLHGYTCDYCHTEYPSFEYIIEEESY